MLTISICFCLRLSGFAFQDGECVSVWIQMTCLWLSVCKICESAPSVCLFSSPFACFVLSQRVTWVGSIWFQNINVLTGVCSLLIIFKEKEWNKLLFSGFGYFQEMYGLENASGLGLAFHLARLFILMIGHCLPLFFHIRCWSLVLVLCGVTCSPWCMLYLLCFAFVLIFFFFLFCSMCFWRRLFGEWAKRVNNMGAILFEPALIWLVGHMFGV